MSFYLNIFKIGWGVRMREELISELGKIENLEFMKEKRRNLGI